MKPKTENKPHQLRIDLTTGGHLHLLKCTELLMRSEKRASPPRRNETIEWALRKCAAEAERG